MGDRLGNDVKIGSLFIHDTDEWALQQLDPGDYTARKSKYKNRGPHKICPKCYGTNWLAAIRAIEAGPHGHVHFLGSHKPFDDACDICSVLSSYVFGIATNRTQQAHHKFLLSATGTSAQFLDNQISELFEPFQKSLLFPGRDLQHRRSYTNAVEELCKGYLCLAKTTDLIEYVKDHSIASGPRSHFTREKYRPDLVRRWMKEAAAVEPAPRQSPAIPGMRVIDCATLRLVDIREHMEYLALSYVWSLANEDMVPFDRAGYADAEDEDARSLPQSVPRVVCNALAVTLDLGYQYLWVDQYCIDQEAQREQLLEHISRMDEVYMCAKLTLIAASTCGALPGVQDTPRSPQVIINLPSTGSDSISDGSGLTFFTTNPDAYDTIKSSLWYQRGWCFQESVLSEARLYFTDHETLFQTPSLMFSETFPEPHENLDIILDGRSETLTISRILGDENIEENEWRDDMFPLDDPRGRFWALLRPICKLVRIYRSKDLSHESDSINAFKGVMRYLSSANPDFGFVAGIPIFLHQPYAKAVHTVQEACHAVKTTCPDTKAFDLSEDQDPYPSPKSLCVESGSTSIAAANSQRSFIVELTEDRIIRFRKKAFTALLLWRHVPLEIQIPPGPVINRQEKFPSWSWAGWQGIVNWGSRSWDFKDEEEDDSDDGNSNIDRDDREQGEEISQNTNDSRRCQDFSTPSRSSQHVWSDWIIQAVTRRNGSVLTLVDWCEAAPYSERHQHTDDAQYLLGEAYILSPEKIMLLSTRTRLEELSKLYNICSKMKRAHWKTYQRIRRLEQGIFDARASISSKVPWLKFDRGNGMPKSSIMKFPGSLILRQKLLRLSKIIYWSVLSDMLERLHVSTASFSVAGLAGVAIDSVALEREVRSKLDDGSWGLLVVNPKTLLVVAWEDETYASANGQNENEIIGDERRICSRVGLLEVNHYLAGTPGIGGITSDMLENTSRIKFCMK